MTVFDANVNQHAANQGCARLIFSGSLDSDSYDNPGDSTRLNSNPKFANLTQLRLTQNPNLLT